MVSSAARRSSVLGISESARASRIHVRLDLAFGLPALAFLLGVALSLVTGRPNPVENGTGPLPCSRALIGHTMDQIGRDARVLG